MKLGVISQWFDPEPGPAALPGVYAREFERAGHDVSVLTGFPNYPSGNLYSGYRQRPHLTTRNGSTSLTRVALYPNHSASSAGRALNYASFAASATVFGGRALRDVDALWVYNSPATVSVPLLTHTRMGRIPYFLHVQDLWPDSLIESGMFPGGMVGHLAARAIAKLVRVTEDHSSMIGVISPSVRDVILERNRDLSPSQILFVPNPTDEDLFRPIAELREAVECQRDNDVFTFMYVGAIGEVQGLSTLLEAARILRGRSDIRFSIVGDGISRERLESSAREQGLLNVTFHGRIEKEQVPLAMATADAQLVSLGIAEFLRYTMPSKIASLLASEVPIVASIAGDGARLLADSGAALIATPGDAEDLADAISRMAAMPTAIRTEMAERGRRYYDSHLAAHVAAETILKSLKGSIDGN